MYTWNYSTNTGAAVVEEKTGRILTTKLTRTQAIQLCRTLNASLTTKEQISNPIKRDMHG